MTMPSELPSLTALQAFEAAVRHRSFSRAAEELNRTQGAISRQVALLERYFRMPLFHREHPRVRPVPAAEVYARKVRAILDRLSAVTLELQASRGAGGVLNLAILPTFGTRWLIPRIPAFLALHPEVSLNFTTRIHPFDFETEELDACIHYGEEVWPGARLEHLMEEEVIVVCSPGLQRRARLRSPPDLASQTLLQLLSRPRAWEEWGEQIDWPGVDPRRGPRFEHHLMVIQAALAGLGVALLPTFLIQEELATGQLVELFPGTAAMSRRGYWLVYPGRSARLPALQAFREWLHAELRRETRD